MTTVQYFDNNIDSKKVLQGIKNLNETASIHEYNKLWHSSEFLHENIRYEFQMKIHTVVEQRN